MNTNAAIVAGASSGKKIRVVPAVEVAYKLLEKKSREGSHWARLSIKGLTALSSGRLDKDNIFVRPGPVVAGGREEFFVSLPGIKATLERRSNDQYYVVDLALDTTYFEVNTDNTMTGLYDAKKSGERWDIEHNSSGRISSEGDTKFVAVTDGSHPDATTAANQIAQMISKAPGSGGVFFKHFGMHYTGGEKSFGGLRNYKLAKNPLNNEAANRSAIMLADTMYRSKNIEGISWVSELGGSAVLTQAMKILVDQNVKLNNHTAFMFEPTTNTDLAVQMAHSLGLQLDRNFAKTSSFNYMGNRNQIGMIFRRVKNESGYKVGNCVWDLVCQGKNVQGATGLATSALGAAGIAMGVPTVPILAAIGGALGVGVAGLKLGDTLAQNIAPRFYNKHIGKIK